MIPIAQMGRSKLHNSSELDLEQPRTGAQFNDSSLISHPHNLVSMGLHECRLMFPVLASIDFWMPPICVSLLSLHAIPCLGRNPHLKYGWAIFTLAHLGNHLLLFHLFGFCSIVPSSFINIITIR